MNSGCTQGLSAKKAKVSRSYVSQLVKQFTDLNLIKETRPEINRGRKYNVSYELAPEVKGKMKGEAGGTFIPVRVHHILRKFHIVQQSAPASKDRRTHFQKEWMMRGGPRYKYWFPGKAGYPSVTLDLHPKTIVIYMDKGQPPIAARSVEEAEKIAWQSVFLAKELFIEKQQDFGVTFEVENVGQQIGNIHYGFLMKQDDPMFQEVINNGGKVGYADYYGDKSPEEKLGEGIGEIETETRHHATRLARAIPMAEAMPDALAEFNKKLDPINENVIQVQAMLQGSITQQQMLENVTKLVTSTLAEMQQIRKENADLRARLGL